MNDIKVIPNTNHSYGQSAFTLNRPMTLQDAFPKTMLDPTKTYKIVNGQAVEIK